MKWKRKIEGKTGNLEDRIYNLENKVRFGYDGEWKMGYTSHKDIGTVVQMILDYFELGIEDQKIDSKLTLMSKEDKRLAK